ncbi:mutS2-like protein [Trifolium pratense]|uniref:MutS2-like protein n=1 Tax=Trifolium pratense TaxID=57577 RepID=A0A2K3P218_TRIPR|nr:mutS2-like protein [Trifolium pratense]
MKGPLSIQSEENRDVARHCSIGIEPRISAECITLLHTQRARALVAKAEADALLTLTKKFQLDVDDIENILNSLVQLDVINARATFGISFGGSNPQIFLPDRNNSSSAESFLTRNDNSNGPLPNNREWVLYLPKCFFKRRNLTLGVAALDKAQPQPVPVDSLVSNKTVL